MTRRTSSGAKTGASAIPAILTAALPTAGILGLTAWSTNGLLSPAVAAGVMGLGLAQFGSLVLLEKRRRPGAPQKVHFAGSATASNLLSEFEESGRGWFWETDDAGALTYISPQLAATIGRSLGVLIGTPLASLVDHDSGEGLLSRRGERTLGFHLSTRLGFSEVAVRAAVTGEDRWWSLSGRPAMDETGNFIGFRGSGTDLTAIRRSEAEIKRLARYDALTGLPNRLLMRQTLDDSLHDGAGRPLSSALLLLDLDRFKTVNDTLGHPIGDALLRQVADRIATVVGESGRVGRLGGDEFNAVLPGIADRSRLTIVARAMIEAVSRPYEVEGAHVSIGASIGIAIAPEDGATADALVRNADLALYAAKADGRGVHRFYEAEMHASAKERRLLEIDLRQVLTEGGLHLVYQPVVNAASERIVGFEALARWDHPVRGAISPADFVPIAEEIGLIPQLGEWVLRTACMEAAHWPDAVRIAVNISPIQFANPSLPALVVSALAESGLAPDRLELEITEGVFLNDDEATDRMFARLKAVGVRFALDDFGTGYSSLGYLRKAPFNKIKIDQSFVRGAAIPGSRNGAIIHSIVTLAESLDMETTAEGAETPEELALIRSLGCSHIQGYIFGKPMAAEAARLRLSGSGEISRDGLLVSRSQRIAMLRSTRLRVGDMILPARIRNISATGALVETDRPVAKGQPVTIEFGEDGSYGGTIRWAHDGRFGMAFDQAIDLTSLTGSRLRESVRKAG